MTKLKCKLCQTEYLTTPSETLSLCPECGYSNKEQQRVLKMTDNFFIEKTIKAHEAEITELRGIIDRLTESILSNTLLIQTLSDLLIEKNILSEEEIKDLASNKLQSFTNDFEQFEASRNNEKSND